MSNPYLEDAKALRADPGTHYNCAQAVMIPFAEDAGLNRDMAGKISENFGGGMRRAATCGAITGGLMVLGLYGVADPAVISEYHRRLKENHEGHLECADLLRINREKGGAKKTHCDGMIYECIELVTEILKERGCIKDEG